MRPRAIITSSANPRLKQVRRLRRRPRHDVFLVEGHRQVAAALESRARVRELYVARELFLGAKDAALLSLAERRGARIHELSARAFESIAGRTRPDGMAAVVERPSTGLDELRLGLHPLCLVAEAVELPGNLGTIVRSACAAGAGALLVCDGVTDPFHPEAVRASAGTIFRLRLAESETPAAIAWLRARSIPIVAATPDARHSYKEVDLCGAIVVGSERHGVSDAWLDAADERVRIPMPGPADSLNVAVAAGVLLCEAAVIREEARGGAQRARSSRRRE
jgi:RNA methyltransferase, TrmH family